MDSPRHPLAIVFGAFWAMIGRGLEIGRRLVRPSLSAGRIGVQSIRAARRPGRTRTARRRNRSRYATRRPLDLQKLEGRSMMAGNVLQQLADVPTQDQAEQVRTALVQAIWRSEKQLPSRAPNAVLRSVPSPVPNIGNLARVDRLSIRMDLGFSSNVEHFVPRARTNRLMIVHQGHASHWNQGIKETIRQFVAEGFDVLAFKMPGYGGTHSLFGANHNGLRSLVSPRLNPVKFFLEPIAVALEHVDVEAFEDVAMTGVSGGGWTTTLYAAIDPRIQYSFPVAGSLPRFLRRAHDAGDWEQRDAGGIYDRVASYLEIYVLASMDDDRVHVQILNRNDPCCFDGASGRHEVYDDIVSRHVDLLGDGSFRVIVDPRNSQHSISSFARQQMLNVLNADSVAVILDDGAAGYRRVGPWRRWTGNGVANDLDFAPAGSGSLTATWEFPVASGIYSVAATWTRHANRATNAPYSIYDGTLLVGQSSVNQRMAPIDLSDLGTTWDELGSFEIRSGKLRVTLNNRANGYVIADAIRIERVGDLPKPPVIAKPTVNQTPDPAACTRRCVRSPRSARMV